MTDAQLRLYRREAGRCRKIWRAAGYSPKEADAMRYESHRIAGVVYPQKHRKAGEPKSSMDMTNGDLSRVLAIFWAWTEAERSDLQLKQFTDAAIMGRFQCRLVLDPLNHDLLSPHCAASLKTPEAQDRYANGIFRSQNSEADPDTGTAEQWHAVFLACIYHYERTIRKALDLAKDTRQRYWPYQHQRNLVAVALHKGLDAHHLEPGEFDDSGLSCPEAEDDLPF